MDITNQSQFRNKKSRVEIGLGIKRVIIIKGDKNPQKCLHIVKKSKKKTFILFTFFTISNSHITRSSYAPSCLTL